MEFALPQDIGFDAAWSNSHPIGKKNTGPAQHEMVWKYTTI